MSRLLRPHKDPNYETRYIKEDEYPKRRIYDLAKEFSKMYGYPFTHSLFFFRAYFALQNTLFNKRYIIARTNFVVYYRTKINPKKQNNVTDKSRKTKN